MGTYRDAADELTDTSTILQRKHTKLDPSVCCRLILMQRCCHFWMNPPTWECFVEAIVASFFSFWHARVAGRASLSSAFALTTSCVKSSALAKPAKLTLSATGLLMYVMEHSPMTHHYVEEEEKEKTSSYMAKVIQANGNVLALTYLVELVAMLQRLAISKDSHTKQQQASTAARLIRRRTRQYASCQQQCNLRQVFFRYSNIQTS